MFQHCVSLVTRFSAFLQEVNARFTTPVQVPAFSLDQAVMMLCGPSQPSNYTVQVMGFFEEDFGIWSLM